MDIPDIIELIASKLDYDGFTNLLFVNKCIYNQLKPQIKVQNTISKEKVSIYHLHPKCYIQFMNVTFNKFKVTYKNETALYSYVNGIIVYKLRLKNNILNGMSYSHKHYESTYKSYYYYNEGNLSILIHCCGTDIEIIYKDICRYIVDSLDYDNIIKHSYTYQQLMEYLSINHIKYKILNPGILSGINNIDDIKSHFGIW